MPIVDADAHVDETEETWAYIDEPYQKYTPVTVKQDPASTGGNQPKGYNRFWFVDGRFLVRGAPATKQSQSKEQRCRKLFPEFIVHDSILLTNCECSQPARLSAAR